MVSARGIGLRARECMHEADQLLASSTSLLHISILDSSLLEAPPEAKASVIRRRYPQDMWGLMIESAEALP